jgi:hypothetical protein
MKIRIGMVIHDAVYEGTPAEGSQEARRLMKAANGRGGGNAFGGSGNRC